MTTDRAAASTGAVPRQRQSRPRRRPTWRVRLDRRISQCEEHARWIFDGHCPECEVDDL